MNTQEKPRYRDEIKGQVAAFKTDFADTLRGEIRYKEEEEFTFVLDPSDTDAWREYSDYLTTRKLRAVARKIMREPVGAV